MEAGPQHCRHEGNCQGSAMSADGICHRKLNSAMPIGHEPSDKIKLGARHRKMAGPLKCLHSESQLCSTQAISRHYKSSGIPKTIPNLFLRDNHQSFKLPTIIPQLSERLFRNFSLLRRSFCKECPDFLIGNPHPPFVRLLSRHLPIGAPGTLVNGLQILHRSAHHRMCLGLQTPGHKRVRFIKVIPGRLADSPVIDISFPVCRREDRAVLPHLRLLNLQPPPCQRREKTRTGTRG